MVRALSRTLLVLLFLPLQAAALTGYKPLFKSLVDGEPMKFRDQAYEEIQREESVARKREILSVLSAYRGQYYELADFDGQILPFNTGACAKATVDPQVCSSHGALDFLVSREKDEQILTFRKKDQKDRPLLAYKARSRTAADQPRVSFGKALHLIIPKADRGDSYVLIREIERARTSSVSLLQTINVFLVRGETVCKIAEGDGESDLHYALIEEFVRSFGPKLSCGQPPVRL